MATAVVLTAACASCLPAAGLAVARLRLVLSKSRAAALTFAVPGLLLILPVGWLLLRGDLLAILPLATVAALCFAAGLLFMPTPATRFADFERQFWAHVRRSGR
jgi:hypothetical protein